jgi:hypothetical protein
MENALTRNSSEENIIEKDDECTKFTQQRSVYFSDNK